MSQVRTCTRCKQPKSYPDEFAKRKNVAGGYITRGHCQGCQRAAQRTTTQKYRERYTIARRAGAKRLYRENMQHVVDYLREHPCVDCGETDWQILQFDHVRGMKSFGIATALSHRNWVHIAKEIEKCDVRCANCHQRKTIAENGFLGYVK